MIGPVQPKDPLSEFDEGLDQAEIERLELGIPADEALGAMVVDPKSLGALVVNPTGGAGFPNARWTTVPMPLRMKAFYLWLDLGDVVSVATTLGQRVSTIRHLMTKDQWLVRADEIRSQLESGLQASWSKTRASTLAWGREFLASLDPAKMAAMADPSSAAALIRAIAQVGGGPGQSVHVHGPAQIVGPGGQAAQINGSDPSKLTDAQLLDEAKALGLRVQPAPEARSAGPILTRGGPGHAQPEAPDPGAPSPGA